MLDYRTRFVRIARGAHVLFPLAIKANYIMTKFVFTHIAAGMLLAFTCGQPCMAEQSNQSNQSKPSNAPKTKESPLQFDTVDPGPGQKNTPLIQPWRTVQLDAEYGGNWCVTGDLDGDGTPEIVSAKNKYGDGIHYTSSAVAHRLDGSVLWKWGNPAEGQAYNGYDVALQIYDWDGDGKNEVILLTQGALIELDGKTGNEKRRFDIPKRATDCLVFVNLSGGERATDVIVKDRYRRIWAYDYLGNQLWGGDWKPGGFPTAHQPRPIDLDNDGKDEIMAGYVMLNSDGTERWIYRSKVMDQSHGHLDCCRVLKHGKTPEDFRLILTCCGDDNIACVDGNGKIIWEHPGFHFESVQIGKIFPNAPHKHLLVDIAHQPEGKNPLWVMDSEGKVLGKTILESSRIHDLVDWTGDGFDEIIVSADRGIIDQHGKRIATFATGASGGALLTGDMTGDTISDVTIVTSDPLAVHVFKNEKGTTTADCGCGVNFTLY